MKVVFVAGPFSGANAWEIEQNVRRAEALALEIWQRGGVAICPHSMNRFFFGTASEEVYREGCLEIIRRVDGVALVDGWERSSGTAGEVSEANVNGIPIFGPDQRELLFAWLRSDSEAIDQDRG